MKLFDLRCEYKINPLGIDIASPRFFWKIKSQEQRGVMQTCCRIEIANDIEFKSLYWDSGKINSDRSTHVEYEGPKLQSFTRYWWRVKIWDQNNNPSDWSEPAWFEMGYINKSWTAKWISADIDANYKTSPLLKRDFSVDSNVNSARIYATARGVYKLWLNGFPVGDQLMTPGFTAYEKRLLYQTYDVTNMLKNGENAIGAMLGNGWYRGDLSTINRDECRPQRELKLELHIKYQDGHRQIISTDNKWIATDGPLLMSEIYHGETYNACLEVTDWNKADSADGCWRNVLVNTEDDKTLIVAQDAPPVRRIEEIRPIALFTTKMNQIILDMGQNMTGFIRFNVKGKAGERVVLKHFEVLDNKGNAYFGNLGGAKQTITYILKGNDVEVYEPFFSFQGFRYVLISEWPGEPDINAFTGVVVHSDIERTGDFSCNVDIINQLQHNIVWGQRSNFLDIPTDCPQRNERLGWTGDAQVFMSTACFNYSVSSFFTKWLRDMTLEQSEDGGIPWDVPNTMDKYSSAAWGDAATICPWTIYEYYGDTRILEECYPMMKRWVEYIRSQGDEEYLWNTGFHFGDWLALDTGGAARSGITSKDLIATAYYALSVKLVAETAAILGYKVDAEEYNKLFKKVRQTFNDEFVSKRGRLDCPSQTAQLLPLHFGLLNETSRNRAIKALLSLIEEKNGHLTTGFVGTPYICHVLTNNSAHIEACSLIMKKDYPSWLYPITKGATTMWEHWDGIRPDGTFVPMDFNSFNHYSFGSIGDWLYRNILGIAPDITKPGFKNVLISPMPCEPFTQANGSLITLYGEIVVLWEKRSTNFKLDLSIPENSTATVVLPSANVDAITENGEPLNKVTGISDISVDAERTILKAGSGKYQFNVKFMSVK